MASSEDFKKYIQAGKLTEALALAMSTAVKLQITTRVLEDEEMALDKNLDKDSAPGDRLRTNVNMVEGKITNEVGEQFTGKNPYKDLKQIHLEQVKEAPKVIQNNLKSLQKLFRLLVAVGQQQLPTVAPVTLTGEQRVLSPATSDPALAAAAIALAIPAAAGSPVDPVVAYGLSSGGLVAEEAEPLLEGGLGEDFPVPVPESLPTPTLPPDSSPEDPITAYNLSGGEEAFDPELVPEDPSIYSQVDAEWSSDNPQVGLGSHRLSSLVNTEIESSPEKSEDPEQAGLSSRRLSSLVNTEVDQVDQVDQVDTEVNADTGSNPESRGQGGFNPLAAVAGVAAAGIAAAVALGATIAKKSPTTEHESLAELEETPQDQLQTEDTENGILDDFTDNEDHTHEDFDDEDFADEDATVIQLATVAYSPSATYIPVTDIPVAERSETTITATTTDPAPETGSPENTLKEDAHEDWVDFGENLPVETVSQIPQGVAGVMAAALEATQLERTTSLEVVVGESPQGAIEDTPEDHSIADHPEAALTGGFGGVAGVANSEEDWGDLELEPLNSADLSSFADTQETAWEDGWEEEIDTPRNLSIPTPPGVNDPTDHSWDEVEEEFDFDRPVGKVGFLDADYRESTEDDGFEILGDIEADSFLSPDVPSHPSAEISEHDPMEDIFGDLDESLLPNIEHKSSLKDLDDFAGFDLDLEEPPSPRK